MFDAGAGLAFYLGCTVLGLTAMARTVPVAYEAIRWAGVGYLVFLAWQTFAGRAGAFAVERVPTRFSGWELFAMGFLTNALNPKIALLYLSVLPQFAHPEVGPVGPQMLRLGAVQIVVSLTVNALLVLGAGTVARWLVGHPARQRGQRWLLGAVLGTWAWRLATEKRAAA